ncbi:SusC/RagA family TonB-linked outer membrane protein [Mucilaginibacter sp. UYCu711]|uniref:SusC/RagA family TonB-linked outer membrane protein n=1 Tax=Mucilaginibacter sp. UYCu711 TaxID=3156339 RepID=UPI003D1D5AF1
MKYLYITLGLLLSLTSYGQTITGIVRNDRNEGLSRVFVMETNTKNNAATDDNGYFKLSLINPTNVLRFSASGYETLDLKVTESKQVSVILTKTENKLDEVQIIAYGTNTQRYNVGSVTKVTAQDIEKQNITNPLAALQGRVPGLVVTASSGLPGSSFQVQIRGQNTLKSTATGINPQDNPLYIIDGVPFATQNGNVNQFTSITSPGNFSAYNNVYGGSSPFNSLNPSDIESIEVLRDADATAIYGSRGGNGVILITTKRGKAGKTEFNTTIKDGVSFVGNTKPMMSINQYLAMRKEAFANDGLTPNLTDGSPAYAPDLLAFDTTRNKDWRKVFFGNVAHSVNVVTGISGGTQSTQFRISSGFNRDTYIFPGGFSDTRATFSASVHHATPEKKLTLDFSTGYSYDKNNSSGTPNLLLVGTLDPDYPEPLDVNGNLVWNYKGVLLGGSVAATNPYAVLKRSYSLQNTNLNSNLLVAYQLIKGLVIKTSLGYNVYDSKEYSGTPIAAQNPIYNPTSLAKFGNNDYLTWIIEPQLEYSGKISKGAFDILIGSTFQRNSNLKTETDGYGYINDALINSISGASTISASDAYNEYKYAAIFGRVNYRWDNKYLLNLNVRRDGSSRFGPDKQFGTFGSVGAGWLFSEETYVKDNFPLISYGKLRGSYGTTGSDAISDYQYFSRWAPTRYTYNGSLGYAPQNLYNSNLSWASTKKLEFGLELGFLKDAILLNASWFQNRSGKQLITYPLASQTGFQSVYENWNAVVQNTGLEFSVQASLLRSKNFKWTTSFNLTLPKNKLLSFPDLQSSSYSTTYFVGKSLNTVTGYNYAGVNPTTGLFQFIDAAGHLNTDPESPYLGSMYDYIIIGNTDPEFYGGLQNSFIYKNFQLDIFAEFKKQLGINYLAQVYSNPPGFEQNLPASFVNRWQNKGQQAEIQRVSTQYGDEYTTGSDFIQSSGAYSDASYIKIRILSFSYQVSTRLLSRLNIHSLRISATGQNLWTISHYKGNDPETQSFYGVPPLKSISLGLNINL